jgi:hypothetical protein
MYLIILLSYDDLYDDDEDGDDGDDDVMRYDL